jgi:hypothetical protein
MLITHGGGMCVINESTMHNISKLPHFEILNTSNLFKIKKKYLVHRGLSAPITSSIET